MYLDLLYPLRFWVWTSTSTPDSGFQVSLRQSKPNQTETSVKCVYFYPNANGQHTGIDPTTQVPPGQLAYRRFFGNQIELDQVERRYNMESPVGWRYVSWQLFQLLTSLAHLLWWPNLWPLGFAHSVPEQRSDCHHRVAISHLSWSPLTAAAVQDMVPAKLWTIRQIKTQLPKFQSLHGKRLPFTAPLARISFCFFT